MKTHIKNVLNEDMDVVKRERRYKLFGITIFKIIDSCQVLITDEE